jgi:hypothetical protein
MKVVTITTGKNSLMSTYEIDDMPHTYFPCDEEDVCRELEHKGWFRFWEESRENCYVQKWKRIGARTLGQ